jgi:hypothetical protein
MKETLEELAEILEYTNGSILTASPCLVYAIKKLKDQNIQK